MRISDSELSTYLQIRLHTNTRLNQHSVGYSFHNALVPNIINPLPRQIAKAGALKNRNIKSLQNFNSNN